MSEQTYERIANIFRNVLTAEQFATFHPGATMDDIDGWDSMTFLQIIMDMEGEFGIRIDGLDAASMISVENILEYLRDKV